MTRAVLHAPSGYELATLELPPTEVAESLEYDNRRYVYAGFQDGVAHYQEEAE